MGVIGGVIRGGGDRGSGGGGVVAGWLVAMETSRGEPVVVSKVDE